MIFSGLQCCFLSWPGYSNVLHLYANVCICIVQWETQLCPPRLPSGVSCGVTVGRWAPCRGTHTVRIQYLGIQGRCDNEERKREKEQLHMVLYSTVVVNWWSLQTHIVSFPYHEVTAPKFTRQKS